MVVNHPGFARIQVTIVLQVCQCLLPLWRTKTRIRTSARHHNFVRIQTTMPLAVAVDQYRRLRFRVSSLTDPGRLLKVVRGITELRERQPRPL